MTNGWQQPPPASGWGTAPSTPTIQPGVIALRPLTISDILDGAIQSIRRNPGPMLGASFVFALVVYSIQAVGLALALGSAAASLFDMSATATPDFNFSSTTAIGVVVVAFSFALQIFGTTLLTGGLTVVVGQAVLGRPITISQAWQQVRPRAWRLIGGTIAYVLLALSPVVAVIGFTLLLFVAGVPDEGVVAVGLLGGLLAMFVTAYLFIRWLLMTIALVLESEPDGSALSIRRAFSRSSELVQGHWWQSFGRILLAGIIAAAVGGVISFPFQIVGGIAAGVVSGAASGLILLLVVTFGQVLATTLTAPFQAAVGALMYVDRRIRREGLDIELARAAGVTIPGRTPGA